MDQEIDLLKLTLTNEERKKLIKPLAPMIIDERHVKRNRKLRKEILNRIKVEKKIAKIIRFVNKKPVSTVKSKLFELDQKEALETNVKQFKYINKFSKPQNKFINGISKNIEDNIYAAIKKYGISKVQFKVEVLLKRGTDENITRLWGHVNQSVNVHKSTNIKLLIQTQIDKLLHLVEEENLEGSDWVISNINFLQVVITKNPNDRGSSYIEAPKIIADKKAILNIQNKNDNECFKWCILASLFPVDSKKHPYRVTNYKNIEHNLNFNNITFPVRIKDIHKFEEANNISINVFGYDIIKKTELVFYALYNSKFNFDRVIDLLYIEEDEVEEGTKEKNGHYALIKNFNKLVNSSLGIKSNAIVCKRCMSHFVSQDVYEKHNYFCINTQPRCEMPKEGEVIKFKNDYRKYPHPIVITADFEALLIPTEDKISHIPASAAFVVDSPDAGDEVERFQLYRGENCLDEFVNGIKSVVNDFAVKHQQFRRANMTEDDWKIHNTSDCCWLCKKEFSNEDVISPKGNSYKPKGKVIDHDHLTGKYIGAAHSDCNFNRKTKYFIPIYFHNLSRYDSHMMLKVINKFGDGNLTIIPKTEEEYISFSKDYYVNVENKNIKYELRFLDSFRILPASLDTLSSNLLQEDKSKFKLLMKYTTEKEQQAIFWDERIETKTTKLILDKDFNHEYKNVKSVEFKPRIKGIYPYDFTNSWEKFNHAELLSKADFYDSLNQKTINDQEYEQYIKVWNSIEEPNIGKYSDLYLKTDVLALADVISNFRDIGLKHYELDPVYYYTTPGYSFDACLKMTDVKLELLNDFRMLQIIENGMRGGISSICGDRYVNVEGKNYITNPEINKEDKNQQWLMYLDANNLYGYAMSQKLPTGNFKWVEDLEKLDKDIRSGNCSDGHILNVELTVPKTSRFENYPLAPETKNITIEQLSDYSKHLIKKDNINGDTYNETSKLLLDFKDKTRYTIHIKNLILYHKLGCEFKINEAISFDESNWLQKYIDLNTELRKKAKNDFEKDFFKLMNNSMFGKTMEAIRERVDIKLANNWNQAAFQIKKPTYNTLKIFDENLIAIHMRKSKILFNKPIYVGFCVLELSKHLMYDTYYNKMQNMFKDVQLLYTDTDSFVLKVTDENIYKIMQKNEDLFDFSDYPKEHVLYSDKNKKVLGKFKDELNGNLMTERISLRSKMYAHKVYNSDKEDKRAKGIKRCNVKNDLTFQKYYDCLMNNKNTTHAFKNFKSINHDIFTITTIKKGLSAFDSKRYYIDAIRSVPFS